MYGEGKGNFFMAKFNSIGQLVWDKALDSTIYNPQVNIGTDGAIYLSGVFDDSLIVSDSLNLWSYYAVHAGFLVKMDSLFYVNWIKVLPGINDEYAFPSKPITDNNQNVYIPVGTLGSFTCDSYTFNSSTLIKFNSAGIIDQFMYTGTGTPKIRYMSDNTIGVIGNTQNCTKILKLGTGLGIVSIGTILFHHDWGPHDAYFDTDENGSFLIAGNTIDSLSFSNSNLLLPMLNFFQKQTYYVRYESYSITTGIYTFFSKKSSINVFPNPSLGNFGVDLSNCEDVRLSVCDVFGNCLITKDCRGDANPQIDLSSQPKGVYFLKILSDNETVVMKIVLQ